uniref:Putative secreted protein n=1 Tax=Anopheles triannulatus TaxID=58253 RepID=A0A2M4B7P5_9DIPT
MRSRSYSNTWFSYLVLTLLWRLVKDLQNCYVHHQNLPAHWLFAHPNLPTATPAHRKFPRHFHQSVRHEEPIRSSKGRPSDIPQTRMSEAYR